MENPFEKHQLVMYNDSIDCYKSSAFLKEKNISLSILQYDSTLFEDFNINALRDSPFLDTMRQYGYTLLGTEPTNVMGGLLDHVYRRNNANFLTRSHFVFIIHIIILLF